MFESTILLILQSPVNVGNYETGSKSLKLDISDDDETLFVASSVEVIALNVSTSA